jgi:hypothetical protein
MQEGMLWVRARFSRLEQEMADRILGAESKALGVHVLLGPVGGPLGKIPQVGGVFR